MPQSSQTHPQVFARVLRDTINCTLTPFSHHPTALALATIPTFSGSALRLSDSQSQALRLLRDKLSQWHAVCSVDAPGIPPASYMQSLLPLFSAIFFLGKLDRVKFAWRKNLSREGDIGEALTDIKNFSTIALDRDSWYQYNNGLHIPHTERRKWILGTLLHECAHAFIDQFSCASNFAAHRSEKACEAAKGRSGHGSAWVQLCSHIQAVASKMLGDVDVGAEDILVADFENFGQMLEEEDIKGCHEDFQHSIRAKCVALRARR